MPWVRVVVVLAVVFALLFLFVWFGQRGLIYFPDRDDPPVPDGASEVELHTDDGLDLTAWEFAPDPTADREAAVLFAPGNAGNRAGRAGLGAALAAEGFTVLLLEYRGYGGNPGMPSEDGLYTDARAAWDHLRGDFEAERILLFGESIGAGVVTELSTEVDPGGMVLRSPFTSLADTGREHYPWLPVRPFLRDRYPVIEHLEDNTAPVTVVYSESDEIIPSEQSTAVAEAAEEAGAPVEVVKVAGAGHNDFALAAGPEVIGAVTDLADSLGLRHRT